VLAKDKPSLPEYVPSRQDVQAAAAEELAPGWPYWPTEQKEPEHVEAPVIYTYIYKNIHMYIYTYNHVMCGGWVGEVWARYRWVRDGGG
jgi:hypothetical protein